MRFFRSPLWMLCLLPVVGCGTTETSVYQDKKPTMTVKEYYSAPIHGYGMFQDSGGEVKDRYYATLVPSWQGNEGTLIENQWNDQGKLFFHQVWHIHVADDGHHFTATATKIDGTVQGDAQGYALHMQYSVRVPRDDGDEISVNSDDWTYLQPDGSGINKVAMSKYGIHVGDVTYDLHRVARGEKLHEGYFIP